LAIIVAFTWPTGSGVLTRFGGEMVESRLVDLFRTKVGFNLRAEASRTYLSYLWWIFEPALYVGVYYVVFGLLLIRGTENFIVFLLCGQIPFLWFSKTVGNSADSISNGRSLIEQVAIPKAFFPLVVVCQDAVKQALVFTLLLGFLGVFGIEPRLGWLSLIPIVLVELALIVACALLVAALVPFVPDLRYLVATGMTLLMFSSGIFYSYADVVSESHQRWFLMNPMASLIECYRDVLMRGVPPDWGALALIGSVSVVAIFLILMLYQKLESVYARLVVQ
jgi:lipopolysaccharide transport system permease protein